MKKVLIALGVCLVLGVGIFILSFSVNKALTQTDSMTEVTEPNSQDNDAQLAPEEEDTQSPNANANNTTSDNAGTTNDNGANNTNTNNNTTDSNTGGNTGSNATNGAGNGNTSNGGNTNSSSKPSGQSNNSSSTTPPTNTDTTTKPVAVSSIWESFSKDGLPKMISLSSTEIATLYGLDTALLDDYVCMTPEMSTNAAEVFIARVKSGNMDTVKAACQTRQKALVNNFANYLPEQEAIAKNYKLVTSGDYILFAIASNAGDMATSFSSLIAN